METMKKGVEQPKSSNEKKVRLSQVPTGFVSDWLKVVRDSREMLADILTTIIIKPDLSEENGNNAEWIIQDLAKISSELRNIETCLSILEPTADEDLAHEPPNELENCTN